MYLTSLATTLPPHELAQSDVKSLSRSLFGPAFERIEHLLDVYDNAQIERRNFCMPIEWFVEEHSFREKNDLYIENAIELSEQAITECLDAVDLGVEEVDYLLFVSTTGVATPSIDARLIESMGFRRDVRRLPIWGLGCAGGVAGLSRALDIVRGRPDARVLVVVVELCGLTFMHEDLSKANLIATALFGDGCAAVLVEGEESVRERGGDTRIRLVESATRTMPDSLDVMGWDISGKGFGIVISRDIPTIVKTFMRESIDDFLDGEGLTADDISALITHPGGAKVLEAYSEALGRPADAFRHTWDVLRDHGNMSAASVLFVLKRFIEEDRASRSAESYRGLLGALGPGFSSDLLLVEFRG